MHLGWMIGDHEIARATAILDHELPGELKADLLPIPSPLHAAWVNIRYQRGLRGLALDYRELELAYSEGESSSCCMDGGGLLKANLKDVFPDYAASSSDLWLEGIGEPTWPSRHCLIINRKDFSVEFFDRKIEMKRYLVRHLFVFTCLSQRRTGIINPKTLCLEGLDRSPAYLTSVFSRIRKHLEESAALLMPSELSEAAIALVHTLVPRKAARVGYRIGRPGLIRIL